MDDCVDLNNLIFHEKLGEGGFGTVNRVTFKKPFQGYAEAAAKSIWSLRKEEVEIMRKLHHPNIVTLLAFYKNGPLNMILLEYAQNGSLHDYLSDQAKDVTDNLVHKWLGESALAIEYLHGYNFLYRDLKSKNCLLFSDNIIKLSDFGLARAIAQSQTTSSRKGTNRYMAPEIHKGNDHGRSVYSKPADIYAYGMLVLEIVSRTPPYEGVEGQAVVLKVLNGEFPTLPRNCPQKLSELLQRCWNADPTQRPSIENIIQELSELKDVTMTVTDHESKTIGADGEKVPALMSANDQTLPPSQGEPLGAEGGQVPALMSADDYQTIPQHQNELLGTEESVSLSVWQVAITFNPKFREQPLQAHRVSCCSNRDIVVGDCFAARSAKNLFTLTSDGEYKDELVSPPTDEKKWKGMVRDIAVSPQGYILVVGTHPYPQVKVFDIDGKYLHCFTTLTADEHPNTKVIPRCIAVDKEGYILVGDQQRHMITIHSCPDGKLVNTVKCRIYPNGSMAVNSKKQILYHFHDPSEYQTRVRTLNYSSKKVLAFKIKPTIGEYDIETYAGGIVCDTDDNIYIAMYLRVDMAYPSYNTGHIHKYSPTGAFLGCIDDELYYPCDLAFSLDGSLVLANQKSIVIYNKRDISFEEKESLDSF